MRGPLGEATIKRLYATPEEVLNQVNEFMTIKYGVFHVRKGQSKLWF
jgi:hypothetical protein